MAPVTPHTNVVLVTGGSGMVGRAVEDYVSKQPTPGWRWVFVGSKDGDLTKAEDVRRIFDDVKPTHVLHLAAAVAGLFANMRNNLSFWRTNTLMQEHIMQECHKRDVAKLVSCLSTCIYPDLVKYPLDETMIHAGPPHMSNAGYAYSKRMIDVQNKLYADQYGRKYTSVVPCNVFGKHDNFSLQDSHVIPGLIHKCYLAKNENKPLTVLGSGTPVRQFTYADDLAKLMVWAVMHYDSIEPINMTVGEEDEVSIKEVAFLVAKAMQFEGAITFDTTASDGQHKKTASNAKLLQHLPDFKFTPIDEALQETVDWFVANYEKARK